MELICVLVLLIVGSATAGPYGYGTKGGAAAKADARAVSGAYAGTGSVPLSIPSGASYSGSFSQASSTSSSSSSSSSSSFTYSGSGAIGGALPSGSGCGSSNCNTVGSTGAQGSSAAGSQAYSGANAGSTAGGYSGKIPAGSYGQKYGNGEFHASNGQDCGPDGCKGANANSVNGNDAGFGSQSHSDAKAAASSGTESASGSDCVGSDCKSAHGSDKCDSGKCDSKDKCLSGSCGNNSPSQSPNECTSGQCGSTPAGSPTENENYDINVHASGYSKTNDATGSGCNNGYCGPTPAKPALDLTAPKIEPACSGATCNQAPSGYGSSSKTKAPFLSTSYQNGNQLGLGGYVGSSKPTYSHGSLPSLLNKPAGADCPPGSSGCNLTPNSVSSDCTSGNCGSNLSGPSKDEPSNYNGNFPSVSPSCAPGTPGCSQSPSTGLTHNPGCASGNCGPHSSVPLSDVKPNYSYGSTPILFPGNPTASACIPGKPGCSTSPTAGKPSDCVSGKCGESPSDYSSSNSKPSYSPSYSAANPSILNCSPGSPGCNAPMSPGSPSIGYGALPSYKPTYSQGGSVPSFLLNPSAPACTPGTPGCVTGISSSDSFGCTSGQCGPKPSGYHSNFNKPDNQGSSLVVSQNNPVKPFGQPCSPGSPGCSSLSGSSDCKSGNCGEKHSAQSYGSSVNYNKPNFDGNSPSYFTGSGCNPGMPGCGLSYPGGHGGKPGYSHGSFSSAPQPKPAACVPGTPGCTLPLGPSIQAGCASGYCDEFPPLGGQNVLSVKPSYSQGDLPSFVPLKPSGPDCVPGSPGCATTLPLNPSGCALGNCGSLPTPPVCAPGTPGCSGGPSGPSPHLPSFIPFKPSGSGCAPGSPGCATTPSLNPSACTSGNCGKLPSPPSCAPGTPGCSGTPLGPSLPTNLGISAPGYGAAGVGTSLHQGGYGAHGTGSYNKLSFGSTSGSDAYTPGLPLEPTSTGVAPVNSEHSISGAATAGASGQHDSKDKPVYTGGFGGPAGLLKPNEFDVAPTSSYSNKPTAPVNGITPVKPICASGFCDTHSAPSSPTNVGSSAPGYGAAAVGSSLHQAGYGTHGTGQYNKPSLGSTSGSAAYTPGLPLVPTSTGVAPVNSQHSISGAATAGASGQHDSKYKPAYTGGFGGPAGLLKPNEFDVTPTSSYSNKPTLPANGLTPAKPICASGICDAQPSSSHAHSGSASDAHAAGGASASANAVAYSGGFGGPPGFLKPYDDGKIDLKSLPGKQSGASLSLNQEGEGSGVHSTYSNGGSQANAGAVVQANAAAVSSAGASSGHTQLHSGTYGSYSQGHGAGGCGGGCGGSGSGGYGGSHSLSKPGAVDGTSEGSATAGAAAKSVASATSGARAFGTSYASSSASAHAGASVKGGYGRR